MRTASPDHRTSRAPGRRPAGPETDDRRGVDSRQDASRQDAGSRRGVHSLLVDAGEFHAAIMPAIRNARRRVLIQVMTFELDGVGGQLWQTLASSPAAEKVLCVDAFSRVKVSDGFIFGRRYWTDAGWRAEVRRTRRLLRPGVWDGVRIVVTNPVGALLQKYPHRNHKKMMIIDDTAFLGGINFSDHNFAWHDLMLQTTDPAIVSALAEDFEVTAAGGNGNGVRPAPGGRLYLLDGRRSRSAYESLFDEITAARASVVVISPYLTNPLLGRLKALPPAVRTLVINPARNNKPLLRQALLGATAGSGVATRLYQPRMSHLKAALIDGERLILGSYNFDFIGWELQQEVVLSIAEPGLAADFRARVLEPDVAASRPATGGRGRAWSRAPAGWAVNAGEAGARVVGRLWG